MSVTSGFFNSVNGDRKYNSEQMSAIFDGIINDGIFANIGTAFTVSASTNYDITVGIGRAWFNSTWIYNDAILPMTLEQPEVILDRIDAVVIEVDHTAAVRAGNIKIVKGTPASTPQNPTMTHTNYVNQYPLAYIYRTAGSSSITQSNITSRIGTSDAPYITGILQVQNIDNIVAQWGAQWIEWYAATTNLGETEMQEMLSQWNSWYANLTSTSESQISSWMTEMQGDFESWFNDLQVVLDGDVATALAARLLALEEKFDTLAKERAIYVPIEDSDNEGITDSVGRAIEGKTVFVSNSDEEVARVETMLNTHIQDSSVHVVTLLHSKEGTVHTLAGIPSGLGIFTAQFQATSDYNYGETFSDGYTGKPLGQGSSLLNKLFVTGDVVPVTVDTDNKRLIFSSGGGSSVALPPLSPNFTANYSADTGKVTLTADPIPTGQATALAGAEWYYAEHIPQSPGDGTKIDLTKEQLTADGGVSVEVIWSPSEASAYFYCRQFPYNSSHQYQTQIVGAVATTDPNYDDGSIVSGIPDFSYTGTYAIVDDGDGNKRVKFFTSGTLIMSRTCVVDAFYVGGGAGGGGGYIYQTGGGGGGYTATHHTITLTANVEYPIVIGAGGSGTKTTVGGNGGETSAFGFSISGGAGVNGGSGGGSSGRSSVAAHNAQGGAGGSDGGNGAMSYNYVGGTGGTSELHYNGVGQGTTTREFGEPDGELYSGGGGGGALAYDSSDKSIGGNGGAGGPSAVGGVGGTATSWDNASGAQSIDGIGGFGAIVDRSSDSRYRSSGGGGGGGYGGGGGAGAGDSRDVDTIGGNGYQGILVIRNKRSA